MGLTLTQIQIYKNLLLTNNPLGNLAKGTKNNQFFQNILMQLRKVCNHPYLFPGVEQPGLPGNLSARTRTIAHTPLILRAPETGARS